ncbi:unnamed protein product [Angiostrongylus costaricensis]|uniref:Mutator family transposase n=1 Tax=Angiostrongylus costaricensis TaxID=334426 RepID=A0A0R3PX45_ANGCS|nr:unnamed protein product [Angiostrongylus costaricensis]
MGFTLPIPMVYSMAAGATAQAPTISTSENGAKQFVMRIVMQAVFDVLEQQGRAAGLPDPIIQAILDQLTVKITYQPLRCDSISVNPMPAAAS